MALGRRLVLVAVLAAAIVAGFMPHAALSAAPGRAAEIVQAAEAPLAGPLHCLDATCGKGTGSAPSPSPGIVLAAVVGGMVAAFALTSSARRRRLHDSPLPVGVTDPFFHPPKSS